MIAKLITWAPDRRAALARMDSALAEMRVSGPGVHTTIGFHRRVLADPVFAAGQARTSFLAKEFEAG